MYALYVSGAVNMQGVVWKCFKHYYIYIKNHSFIQNLVDAC